MIRKRILCDHCRGSGAASDSDIHQCTGCGGSGVKIVKQQIFPGMYAQSQVTCNDCGGRGTVIGKQCPHCQGQKVLDHSAHYTLEIPPGMPEEHEVAFEGEGDESPDWEPGDVILRVRSRKEKGGWRRKESSLYWKETIGIDEVSYIAIVLCASARFLPLIIDPSGITWVRSELDPSRRTHRSTCTRGRNTAWYVTLHIPAD
jgi:DnaJ-related protein SCJ1